MNIQAQCARSGRAGFGCRLLAGVIAAALAGCQNMPMTGTAAAPGEPGCKALGGNSNTQNAVIGGVGGATLGAVLGGLVGGGSSRSATNGALIGALGGAIAGSQYNRMIGMTEQPDGSVRMNIPGAVMFRSGSAEISPAFGATLSSVAGTVREYCGLSATVIGHTDSIGGPERNQRLSNERASSVVSYLVSQGVRPDHLRAEGRGMNEPIATNANEAGRAQNRRVEIFVRQGSI